MTKTLHFLPLNFVRSSSDNRFEKFSQTIASCTCGCFLMSDTNRVTPISISSSEFGNPPVVCGVSLVEFRRFTRDFGFRGSLLRRCF